MRYHGEESRRKSEQCNLDVVLPGAVSSDLPYRDLILRWLALLILTRT